LRLKEGFKIEELEFEKDEILKSFYLNYNFSENINIDYIATIINENNSKKNYIISVEIYLRMAKFKFKKFIEFKKVFNKII
jgi:hypothetical protein